jgi:hypothetical protein
MMPKKDLSGPTFLECEESKYVSHKVTLGPINVKPMIGGISSSFLVRPVGAVVRLGRKEGYLLMNIPGERRFFPEVCCLSGRSY